MNLETDTPIQAFKGVLTYSQGEHMYSVSSEQDKPCYLFHFKQKTATASLPWL